MNISSLKVYTENGTVVRGGGGVRNVKLSRESASHCSNCAVENFKQLVCVTFPIRRILKI